MTNTLTLCPLCLISFSYIEWLSYTQGKPLENRDRGVGDTYTPSQGKTAKTGLKTLLIGLSYCRCICLEWFGIQSNPPPQPSHPHSPTNAPMWCIPSPLHSVPITTPPPHHCTNVVHHSVPIINEPLCQCTNVVHHSVPIMVAHQCGASRIVGQGFIMRNDTPPFCQGGFSKVDTPIKQTPMVPGRGPHRP